MIAIALFVLSIAYFGFIFYWLHHWTDRGAAGDMVGGLAALFSGVGLLAVAYTLTLQRTELRPLVEQHEKAERRRWCELLPRFELSPKNRGYEKGTLKLELINRGARIEYLRTSSFENCVSVELKETSLIPKGGPMHLSVRFEPPPGSPSPFSFVLDFLDIDYNQRQTRISYSPYDDLRAQPLDI